MQASHSAQLPRRPGPVARRLDHALSRLNEASQPAVIFVSGLIALGIGIGVPAVLAYYWVQQWGN